MSSANKKINGQELKFPVDWEYRIIVEADKLEAARAAIGQCLREHGGLRRGPRGSALGGAAATVRSRRRSS